MDRERFTRGEKIKCAGESACQTYEPEEIASDDGK